jgi:ketosteroid isomerase-like protein
MSAPDVVLRYLAGLSSADVDRVLACVSAGFFNEHTSSLGSSCNGKDTYAGRLPGFLGQFEGLAYDVVDSITERHADGSDRVAVRYRMTAAFDGHPIDIPGVMLFEVVDGLIARRTDVWDSQTFLRQTGAA